VRVATQGQLHFELVASTKLLTELTTPAALVATAAICVAEGLDGSAFTALSSVSTDDVTALVWVGKSLLASLTAVVASLWIVVSCDLRALIPLLETELGRFLTEFSRLVRAEQYDGLLLLPQPASVMSKRTATITAATAIPVDPRRACAPDLFRLAFIAIREVMAASRARHRPKGLISTSRPESRL